MTNIFQRGWNHQSARKWEMIFLPTSWTGKFLCGCPLLWADSRWCDGCVQKMKRIQDGAQVDSLPVSYAFQMNQKNIILPLPYDPHAGEIPNLSGQTKLWSVIYPQYIYPNVAGFTPIIYYLHTFAAEPPHSSSSNSFDPHFSHWIHPLLVKSSPGWWWLEHFYFSISWDFHHPNWRTPSFFR